MGLWEIVTGRGRSVSLPDDGEAGLDAVARSEAAALEARQALAALREVSGASLYPRWEQARPQRRTWTQEAAILRGLSASAWVYICVDAIAGAAAQVPMTARIWRRGQWEALPPDHPLSQLLRRPNPAMTWGALTYLVTSHHVLSGEGYLGKLRAGLRYPVELWPRSPAHLTPVLGDGLVAYYEDRVGGERKPDQPAADIIRWVTPDPANPARGLSPLLVGQDAVDVDAEGRQWQRSSLSNGVMPSGVITEPEGSVPLEMETWRINKRTFEAAHKGAANARGLLYLDGGRSFTPLAMTNVELDLVASLRANLDTLLALFGVPGPVVGLYDAATYNNVTTAHAQFWRDTVLSYVQGLAEALTLDLAPEFGEGIEVVPDTTGIYYLNLLTPEMVAVAEGLRRLGAPVSEINRRLGLGLEAWAGWDAPGGSTSRE